VKHHNAARIILVCTPATLGIILLFCLLGILEHVEITGTARDLLIACLAIPPALTSGILMGYSLVSAITKLDEKKGHSK